MSRALRIEYPGAFYHVMAHGNGRQWLYRNAEDYESFLEEMERAREKYSVEIYSYTLMTNHYHLLPETKEGNLGEFMRCLNNRYAIKFNKKYKRKGSVFRPHYKALIVEKDAYLLELSRYIHLNPVRAKMVKRPEEYRWSSYREVIGKAKQKWIKSDWILGIFGRNIEDAKKKYQEYVEERLEGLESPWEKIKLGYILGEDEFVEKIKERVGKKEGVTNISGIKKFKTTFPSGRPGLTETPKAIMEILSRRYQVNEEDLKKDREKKRIAVYLIYRNSSCKEEEIGQMFGGLSYSGVSQIVRRIRNTDGVWKEIKSIGRKHGLAI